MATEYELERLVVRLMGDGSQYASMIKEADAVTATLVSELKRLGSSEKDYQRTAANTAAVVKQSEMALGAYRWEHRRLQGLLDAGRISQDSYNRQLDKARSSLGGVASALDRHLTQMTRGIELTKASENALEGYNRRLAELRTLLASGAISQQVFNRQAVEASQAMGQAISSMGSSIRGIGTSISIYITAPLAALLTVSAAAAVKMDSLKRGLDTVSGGSSETAKQLIRLREVAKLPGLSLEEAIQGSTNLQAAGLSARMAERSLMAFGNALASVGRGKTELAMVNRALTQIMGKGKVMAQEINQMAEHLPQIRRAMVGAFGTANTEALQEMGLTAQQFVEGIIKELEKLPKVTSGPKIALENLADAAFITFSQIGNAVLTILVPVINKLIPLITWVGKTFEGLHPVIKIIIVVIIGLVAAIGPLLVVIGTAIMLAGQLAIAYTALTTTTIALTAAKTALALASTVAATALKGLAIGAILVVAYAVYQALPAIRKFNEELIRSKTLTDQLIERQGKQVEKILEHAAALTSGRQRRAFLEDELKMASKNLTGLENRLKGAKQALEDALPKGRLSHWEFEGAVEKEAVASLEQQVQITQHAVEKLKTSLVDLEEVNIGGGSATPEQVKTAKDYANSLQMQANTFGMLSREAKIAEFAMAGVSAEILNVMLVEDQRLTELEKTAKAQEEATKQAEELSKGIESFTESLQDEIEAIGFSADETKRWELAQAGATAETLKEVDALIALKESMQLDDDITKLNESLEKQIATMGMSADEVKMWELAQRGASDEILAATAALISHKKALEEHHKLIEEGKKLIEKHLSPQQKYTQQYEELAKMLAIGAIDGRTFQAELREINQELFDAQDKANVNVQFTVEGNEAVRAGTKEFRKLLADVEKNNILAKMEVEAAGIRKGVDIKVAGMPKLPEITFPTIPAPRIGMLPTGTPSSPVPMNPRGSLHMSRSESIAAESSNIEALLERIATGIEEMADNEPVTLRPMSSLGT